MSGCAAAHIGIQGFDPVHQTLLLEKIEGAVNSGRGGTPVFIVQKCKQIISLYRFMTAPYQFQYAPPYFCQAVALVAAGGFRGVKGQGDAGGMPMPAPGKFPQNLCLGHWINPLLTKTLYYNITNRGEIHQIIAVSLRSIHPRFSGIRKLWKGFAVG